jgi:glyoxylase-like metal-dependent hydrolase (beta-lactamase superfamily II)
VSIYTLDLHFLGLEKAIGAYLVETDDGLALHDCGPATTLPRLEECLRELDVELDDVRHLLLSHIHFDHAGAAGSLVRRNPGLTVWVSEIGARHLIDPSRLEASARRLYGDDFDRLWGELVPLPEANVRIADGDAVGWEAFPTPGHASHHVCYLRDGVLLAGDVCGIRLQPKPYVFPPTPPPDIDVEAWHASVREIERREPECLALVHFGIEGDVPDHLGRLHVELDRWSALVRDGATLEEFVARAHALVAGDEEVHDATDVLGQSWLGLRRYWDKRAEAEAAAASA